MTKVCQRVKHAHAMKGGKVSLAQCKVCECSSHRTKQLGGRLREGGVQPGHTAKPALPRPSVCLSPLQPNL